MTMINQHSGDKDPKACECEGVRHVVQGMDRRPGHKEQVLTFCRRCNGLVNQADTELLVGTHYDTTFDSTKTTSNRP